MKTCLRIIFLGAVLFSYGASANDSLARVGAGGLELLKTDNIQMVSEVLEISPSRIRVRYHFLNTSDHDIKTAVAFPMPAFDDSGAVEGVRENQRPLDSFKILVNGALVGVNVSRVFLINNIDVTDKLRKIGLSEQQIFDPKFSCFNDYNVNAECQRMLTKEQKKAIESLNTGGNWQIKETAFWEQTFPAGKEIEVVHEYKAFAGWHPGGPVLGSKTVMDACLDHEMIKAIQRRTHETEDGTISFQDVEYILGTGRNWQGPIKNFKLIIKKESADDVVSLCFPGKPERTGPTTIEFKQTDYIPQDKLVVLFFYIGAARINNQMNSIRNR